MSSSNRLLVIGHSLRPESSPIIEQGLTLARALGARAVVVHAVTPMREFTRGAEVVPDEAEQHRKVLAELEADLAPLSDASGLDVQCHVGTGPPEVVLERFAQSLDADMIVVGPAHPGALARGALGSSTKKLLRAAEYPVLVVRSSIEVPLRLVLAAVDFSRHSMWGLWLAEELVSELSGEEATEVEVLTVLSESEVAEPVSGDALLRFVTAHLESWAGEAPVFQGLEESLLVRRGDVQSAILEEIERRSPDLLVVGSCGRDGAHAGNRIGRVATQMALNSPVSVLFVPPRAALAMEAVSQRLR